MRVLQPRAMTVTGNLLPQGSGASRMHCEHTYEMQEDACDSVETA
jgi:hypothetical protein